MNNQPFWPRVWPPVIAALLGALVIAAFTTWADVAGFKIVIDRMQKDLQKIGEDQTKWIDRMDERLRKLEMASQPQLRNGNSFGDSPLLEMAPVLKGK